MKYEDLVGKTIKGFKFESNKYNHIYYSPQMNKCVGKEGVILKYRDVAKLFDIEFKNGDLWSYPTHLVLEQYEKEQSEVETIDLNDLFKQIKKM